MDSIISAIITSTALATAGKLASTSDEASMISAITSTALAAAGKLASTSNEASMISAITSTALAAAGKLASTSNEASMISGIRFRLAEAEKLASTSNEEAHCAIMFPTRTVSKAVTVINNDVAQPELSSENNTTVVEPSQSDEIVVVMAEPIIVRYFHVYDDFTEEISKIVTTINNHLHKARTSSSSSSSTSKPWTICRVPKHLTDIHEHGFHPKLISIGPFHYCQTMKEHKERLCLRLLNSLKLNSTTTASTDKSESSNQAIITTNTEKKKSLADQMKELHTHAKAWYSLAASDHSFTPQEFVMMLILDGCFVVQLLRLYSKENDDPIFSTLWMLPKFQRDLLLLENQLPYFVLEKIFEITSTKEEKNETSLAQLALKFFDPLLHREENSLKKFITDAKGAEHDHLLGLFRSSFLSSFKDKKSTTVAIKIDVPLVFGKINFIHCVSELKEAGVVFYKRDKHDLLDIEFKNGKLYIPPLSIDDHTCPLFLNFIAYEQCNINAEPYFTHYFLFFDSLVNSSKDVEHLHYREIINHGLGSDEDVADLFNKLCKEVVQDVNSSYLSQVSKDVNRYFRIKRHKWWATWKHDYLRNPWAFLAFLGAIIILLLTTIQSFFAVFAYFRPPSSKPN